MAKISGNYEVVYIIDPALGEEAIAATVEKFKALAEQHGCAGVEVEEWGKRKLAYASTTRPRAITFSCPSPAAPNSPGSWTVSWALPTESSAP